MTHSRRYPVNTLLKITSSIYGEDGESSKLARRFADNWRRNNPGGTVVNRDLSAEPVPHLTADGFRAFSSKGGALSAGQQAAVDLSDALIAELKSADQVVIAAPMYNFDVPSTLRAYFDYIARAGVTFHYTADGPEGLLRGKKTSVIVTRGGEYAKEADTQVAYLAQFLGFIGLTDVEWVLAERLAIGAGTRVASLDAAYDRIGVLQPLSAAAG
jgi:FMN-dependent NADH-azoreductase